MVLSKPVFSTNTSTKVKLTNSNVSRDDNKGGDAIETNYVACENDRGQTDVPRFIITNYDNNRITGTNKFDYNVKTTTLFRLIRKKFFEGAQYLLSRTIWD
mmetsp:Transcript_35560/g.43544  ORF Transcript_35560/g.43544 Transcript_35560/m.43544 type:complete len:101 (-) Transcript_35560:110-412(-)